MKEYLKEYINALGEDSSKMEEAIPINIDEAKHNIEKIRITEAISIAKEEEILSEKPINDKQNKQEISEENIQKHDNAQWDIYKERVFIKTLLHQRFNYFIIIYAFTVLSAAIVNIKVLQCIILTTGLFILALLWVNLSRIYIQYEEIYKLYHKAANHHSIIDIIEKKIDERESIISRFPTNSILTYAVPALCLVSIFCYLTIILVML